MKDLSILLGCCSRPSASPLGARLCLLVLALAPRVGAQNTDWQVETGRAGKVVIGMTVDSLRTVFGRENIRLVDLDLEGQFTPALQIFVPSQPGKPIASAEIRELCGFRISRITAMSPLFRTADGLGPGSTVAEIRRKYPTASLNREEGASLIVSKLHMSFVPADGTFADSARIESVFLSGPWPDSLSKCGQ